MIKDFQYVSPNWGSKKDATFSHPFLSSMIHRQRKTNTFNFLLFNCSN